MVPAIKARDFTFTSLSDDSDPLVLQLKEAQTSVLEPHLGKSAYRQHGRRVVEIRLGDGAHKTPALVVVEADVVVLLGASVVVINSSPAGT